MTTKHARKAFSLLFFALPILLIVLFPSTSSAEHFCADCHKKIESSWLEVDGKYYHPEHFVCSNCLKPIAEPNFFIQNNKYYDSTCFATFISKRCAYCGKSIIGEIIYFNSHVYHASCYNESVGQRCVVCGEVVMEEFFVDYKNNAVCKIHKDQSKRCHACHQFLSPEFNGSWQEFKDNRIICTDCNASAVHEIREAREMAKKIQNELKATGIEIKQDFTLTFVSMQELNSNLEEFLVDHLGVTLYEKSEMLGGLFSSKKYKIKVLYGLPRSLLLSVLAHELMHVWLFANSPQPQDQQMCEGTCQYAAYLVLQKDETDDGRYFLDYLVNQEDKIYGQGFQKVFGYVNNVGLNAWLDYLKHNKDAPW